MDFIWQLLVKAGIILKRFSLKQRIIIPVVTFTAAIAVIMLTGWANERSYKTLYSKLDAEIAQTIIVKLEEEGYKYQLTENGTEIQVPEGQETRIRLEIVEEGLVGGQTVGFNSFDKQNILKKNKKIKSQIH